MSYHIGVSRPGKKGPGFCSNWFCLQHCLYHLIVAWLSPTYCVLKCHLLVCRRDTLISWLCSEEKGKSIWTFTKHQNSAWYLRDSWSILTLPFSSLPEVVIVHFQIIPTFSFVLLLLLSPALEPGITSTYVSASFECAFKVTAYLSSQEPTERNHPIPFLLLLPARWRHESTHCLDMDSPWITELLSLRFLYWIKSVGISCHTPFCFSLITRDPWFSQRACCILFLNTQF